MRLFNSDRLKELLKSRKEPCISIYIPTEYEWSKKEEDRIRFKNQLQEVTKQLKQKGYEQSAIEKLLSDANILYRDEEFWKHTSNGLAMFISPGETFYYRLPVKFDEYSEVSYRYHIKPLLPLISEDGRYFIITLDLNETKLFYGSKYSISEVKLPKDTPTSLDEAMKLDDPEKSIQFHTGAGGAAGDRPAVFHGQGTGKDDKIEKKQILRFFQMFNNGVMESLAKENVPLILIGVEYLIPIYREANSYSHLHDEAIDINPQELRPKEIHAKAWEKIEPIFKQSETEAINEYGNKSNDELTSTNIEEVIKASVNHRVDKLFINTEKQIWGKFDRKADKLKIDDKPTVENEDLQDFAIKHTIENNGVVYTLNNDRMINQNSLAAIFRYPTA